MVARNVKVEGTFCAAGTFTAKICFYVYAWPFILFLYFIYARKFYARTHVTNYATVEIHPYNRPQNSWFETTWQDGHVDWHYIFFPEIALKSS